MKTVKKAMAVAAAIGLTVSGSGASFGAETSADATAVSYSEATLNDGGSADSTITGHIKVTSISVKVPVTSSFDIDPNKEVAAAGAGDSQMGNQATNYTITNLSTVPLDITITKVATGADVGLVNTVADLDAKDKNILFAVRESSETAPALPGGADDAKWMTTAISVDSPYKVAATDAKNTIEAKGAAGGADALTMKVYAATKRGWKAGDSFTVTPSFTVALHTATP